jgi:hypothetical protein
MNGMAGKFIIMDGLSVQTVTRKGNCLLRSLNVLALDGGEWSALRPGRALPPGKGPPVPIGEEAGWAPEPV